MYSLTGIKHSYVSPHNVPYLVVTGIPDPQICSNKGPVVGFEDAKDKLSIHRPISYSVSKAANKIMMGAFFPTMLQEFQQSWVTEICILEEGQRK